MAYKILIVDNAQVIRLQMKKAFEDAGFEVFEAADGKIGLDIASNRFDLDVIITDISMDEMDGLTMISRMRALSHLSKIPILVLSTEKTDDSKAQATALEVKAWMVKPWNAPKVISFISNLLSSKSV